MRIRLTRTLGPHQTGDTINVPTGTAQQLIGTGLATPAPKKRPPKKKPPPTETDPPTHSPHPDTDPPPHQ